MVAAAARSAEPAHALRLLLSSSLALSTVMAKPRAGRLTTLTREVERAWRLTHGAVFTELVPLLVELLPRLESAARAATDPAVREQAYALLAGGYQATAAVLVQLGEIETAWVAADRAIAAAERADDPVLMAAGAFRLTLVFQSDRRHDQAELTARTAVDAIAPLVGTGAPEVLSVAGALRLQLAVTAARANDSERAYAELALARELAETLGVDRNDYQLEFGPTNVRLHEIGVAVDIGDAGTALRLAAGVDHRTMSPERRSRMLIDVARAHLQRRNATGVVRALSEAENTAPEHVRAHRLVKNILYDLVRSEHRADPTVRRLARRCGIYVR